MMQVLGLFFIQVMVEHQFLEEQEVLLVVLVRYLVQKLVQELMDPTMVAVVVVDNRCIVLVALAVMVLLASS
jgi:hypothetical protein